MSVMSDLDLMVREGDRTAEDFEARGIDPERAEAMAALVADSNVEPVYGMLGDSQLARDIAADRVNREREAYEVLREFGLIDGEGFYTIYETKR